MALHRACERARLDAPGAEPFPSCDPEHCLVDASVATERLQDALRAEPVRTVLERARLAGRARLRWLVIPYLDLSARPADREARVRWSRCADRDGGFAQHALSAASPSERESVRRRWTRAVDELDDCLEQRLLDAERAAVRAGASDVPELLRGPRESSDGELLGKRAERVWIAPSDDRVLREARDRLARAERRLGPLDEGLADTILARLADCNDVGPEPGGWRGIVRRIGSGLGFDPDGRGPRLDAGLVSGWDVPVWALAPERPRLALGESVRGPGGGRAALAALGSALRATWIRARHGDQALLGIDPACRSAAQTLFARLVGCERFADWAGVPRRDSWIADVRFEQEIEVRRWWARGGAWLAEAGAPAGESWRRATGRADPPDARLLAARWDVDPLDRLRGSSYAVLLEERLRSRWGRAWFADRGAGRWLAEVWDAEALEGPEIVADSWGLGRMDAAPLIEGYRA